MAGDNSWPVVCFTALLEKGWRLKSPFYWWIVDFIAFIQADVNLYEVNRLVSDVKLLEVILNRALTAVF